MNKLGRGRVGASKIGAQAVENIGNNLIFTKECVFSLSKRFTIPASTSTIDILLDPTPLIGSGKFLVLEPIFFQAFGAGPIEVDIYAGVDADDDGTLWSLTNRNQFSVKTALSVFRLAPTINNVGTKSEPEFEIPSDGTPAIATIGGQSEDSRVININYNVKQMFRLKNIESTSARGLIALNVYEL